MLVYVRGTVFGRYLKEGYNVINRRLVGDSPDDSEDYFMLLGFSKNLDIAKRIAKKQEVETEIREFRLQKPEKDS